MTHYIEVPTNTGKAQYLMEHHEAKRTTPGISQDPDHFTVCVVQNGPFDAAAICMSQLDIHDFTDPTDPRPSTWLLVPTQECLKLSASFRRHMDKHQPA